MDGEMLNYTKESYHLNYQQYHSRTSNPMAKSPSRSYASGSFQNSSIITEDRRSPGNTVDYDEDEIRSKLRELERELLEDHDNDEDDDLLKNGDWATPIKNLLAPTSTNKVETRTVKQMLFDCAATISEGNLGEAEAMVTLLRQTVSVNGDPPQRLAAYLVEGLAARMAYSGKSIYKALRCKEPPTLDRLSAMQILFEICPCFKFGFMAANGAILEAIRSFDRVHVIDFDVNQGSQYFTLLQALARWQVKPRLRITGVDDPESVQRSVGGLKLIGQRLEKLAEELKIPFEFRPLGAKTADVTPPMLDCQQGEALVVNFAFQLHHMPDESVSTINQRDQLLRMIKGMNPRIVTIVEQDVNTNTAPFFPRFVEVYNYYSAIFTSLDATLPRESPDRMNVERHCLARDIVNIVACEGVDRIERYEVAGKWKARMTMAGFASCPMSSEVKGEIINLLKSYSDRYTAEDVGGALCFGWENKSLILASAWK